LDNFTEKKTKAEEANKNLKGQLSHLEKELKETERKLNVCAVDLENPVNTVFLPCKHACACKGCAERLLKEKSRCPMCQGKIEAMHELFF